MSDRLLTETFCIFCANDVTECGKLTPQSASKASKLLAEEIFREVINHFKDELAKTEKRYGEVLYQPLRGRIYTKIEDLKQVIWHFENDAKWNTFQEKWLK